MAKIGRKLLMRCKDEAEEMGGGSDGALVVLACLKVAAQRRTQELAQTSEVQGPRRLVDPVGKIR